jgi:hypothetical protein
LELFVMSLTWMLVGVVVLVAPEMPAEAMADDCIAFSGARIFGSASGLHGFRFRLADDRRQVEGLLFGFDDKGRERRIWRTRLLTVPARALVSGDGRTVVTIDQWCRMGYEHSLVVYGEGGRVLADYRLEDLLSADEIDTRVTSSISSRWWTEGADLTIDESTRMLRVRLAWGREFRVDLVTGALADKPRTGA